MKYQVVDADTHTVEPPDMWQRFLPAKYQDQAPTLVKDPRGGDAWKFGPDAPARPIGMVSTPGKQYEEMHWLGATYDSIRKGCYDGHGRLEDMDIDGRDAEIIYPWPSMINYFLDHPDDGLHEAAIHAYNDWVYNDFAAADHARLFPMFQMPNLGIETSIAELRRAKKEGYKGIVLSRFPSGGSALSPDDDPFWAEAQDLDMPINVHISIGGATRAQLAKQGKPQVIANPDPSGLLGGVVGAFSDVMIRFIISGMFDRFPRLKMIAVETQAGWIPCALEFYDDRFWRNRTMAGSTLKHLPSEYFRRNWAATFIIDKYAVRNRREIGVGNIMWSTDYPHHGCDWPHSRKVIDQMFVGVPDDERRRITCANAVEIYGLDRN